MLLQYLQQYNGRWYVLQGSQTRAARSPDAAKMPLASRYTLYRLLQVIRPTSTALYGALQQAQTFECTATKLLAAAELKQTLA